MEPTNITLRRGTLGGLLRIVQEAVRERVYARMADAGFPDLRPAHSSLFRNIGEAGSRVSDLAERAQMTKQSMGYLADSLAAAGYVVVGPDPSDGRAKLVRLTEQGRAAWDALAACSAEVEREFGGLIGAAGMVELRRNLERLAAGLAQAAARP